jgi:hypothetical protein
MNWTWRTELETLVKNMESESDMSIYTLNQCRFALLNAPDAVVDFS